MSQVWTISLPLGPRKADDNEDSRPTPLAEAPRAPVKKEVWTGKHPMCL